MSQGGSLCPLFRGLPLCALCIHPMYFGVLFLLLIFIYLSLPIKKKSNYGIG